MNPIAKFIYHSSLYTTAVTIAFFLFAKVLNVSGMHLTFGRYFLILSFGFILSASENIFSIKKISVYLRYLMHYAVLGVAFSIIFLNIRKTDETYIFGIETVIASLLVFTVFYITAVMLFVFLKKKFSKLDKKANNKTNENKQQYTSRFS